MNIFNRNVEPLIFEPLLDTLAVLLAGPRQVGKTTLVKQIAKANGDLVALKLKPPLPSRRSTYVTSRI